MNILITGCGKVGATLASVLDKKGHDVSIIDQTEAHFDLLPPNYSGFKTTGVPFDRDVLQQAGISSCDALFALTDDDDINIMVSELAKHIYGIPKVFARLHDIRKCEVFEDEGIRIVCPTKLTVNAAISALEEHDSDGAELTFENSTVQFTTMELPETMVGGSTEDIEYEDEEILFGVIRKSSGLTLYNGRPLVFEDGDKLIFAKKL